MRVAVSVERFKRALNSLIGTPLSAAGVTRDYQSSISLDFGRLTHRENRADEERHNGDAGEDRSAIEISADGVRYVESGHEQCVGESTLAIWCNWRIEMGESHIVCGSLDSAEEGRPIQIEVREMIGDVVAEISLNAFYDLLVVLRSGKQLRLFCDQSGHENNDDCYRLSTADGEVYGVITGLIERIMNSRTL